MGCVVLPAVAPGSLDPWSMCGQGLLYYPHACPAICWSGLKEYLLRAILQPRWLMSLDCVFTSDRNVNNCSKYKDINEMENLT